MHRTTFVLFVASAILVLASGLGPIPASAHKHVYPPGYELNVGWVTEPAIVGSLNGLDLGIIDNGTREWVVGVEGNLTATLRTGSDSVLKALRPQFGEPGWYTFDVIPTRPGAYSVRLVGTLNTTAVDVTVDLEPVAPRSDIEFPIPDPTPTELEGQITALSNENAALRAQVGTALAIGVAGVLLGVLGVAVGALVGRKVRRSP